MSDDRARRLAQMLIEEIGAFGPESAEQTMERATALIRKLRETLNKTNRLLTDERAAHVVTAIELDDERAEHEETRLEMAANGTSCYD